MVADIRRLGTAPGIDDERLERFAVMIVRQMLYLSLEYLEQPRERSRLVQQGADFIVALLTGATVLSQRQTG
jgi:hypothetical protein